MWTFYMDFLLFLTTVNPAAMLVSSIGNRKPFLPTSSFTMHPKQGSVKMDINKC